MNVLITGACGFIGRQLIAELEARGHQLRLLDRVRPEDATVFRGAERAAIPLLTDWPCVQAEITDEEAMLAACDGIDAVAYRAAFYRFCSARFRLRPPVPSGRLALRLRSARSDCPRHKLV